MVPTTFELNRSDLNPGQWRFLQSRRRGVLLSGGFGAGKTLGLALKILQLKCENPYAPGLVVAQDYTALWSVVVPALMKIFRHIFPTDALPRVSMGKQRHLDFGDGVPVYLRSSTRPGAIDGLDVGWLCGDELRHWSKRTYEIAIGRVRVRCPFPQSAFSSTPEMHWMADDFFYQTSPQRQLITAPTVENERNLAPGYIDNLRLSYSKRMQQVVIDGQFGLLEGAVYEQLDLDFWDSPWAVDHNPDDYPYAPIDLAVDPGFRRASYLWIQQRSPCDWVVIDQYCPENTSDGRDVEVINNKPWKIDEIWCDPAGDATQSTMGLDTLDMLQAVYTTDTDAIRLITHPEFRRIPYGVDKVRTLLGDPSIDQPIRLRFSTRLREYEAERPRGIVKDMLAYKYEELVDGRAVSDKPKKDGRTDHSNDALRYWGVGKCLSNEHLRSLDPRIDKISKGALGYRRAA